MDSLPVNSKDVKRETLRDPLLKLVYEMTMIGWLEKPMPAEAPIHPCEWPQRARQRIHVNFAGRLQGRMFMVVVEAFSKWPEEV